ncbi:MAG TPA: hypothetical protein VIJ12_02130 [Candidatus Baltobacteraceae bacterium]
MLNGRSLFTSLLIGAGLLAAGVAAAPPPRAVHHKPVVTPSPAPTESPDRLLARIRRVFRSHRPPPPYVTYTLIRAQSTDQGYPDYVNSYTYHIWTRTLDRASLARKVFRDDYEGPLEFQRPAFNEDYDPGPPTADVFEPAPVHKQAITVVPTPEPTGTLPPLIATVHAFGEFDYHVTGVTTEGELLHLTLVPIRDPERNRLRDIYVDKQTLELRKLVATDRLFLQRGPVYGTIFTITMGSLDGTPVVTHIHGVVGKDAQGEDYIGDGKIIDYDFTDVGFPKSLPSWYFDARQYAQHQADAPE